MRYGEERQHEGGNTGELAEPTSARSVRFWNAVSPWATPALLLLIAGAQFGFAHFSSLSPWKGGGFGMFSTADSPGARFVRIYLITDQGEVPVVAPYSLRERFRELRTTGSERLAARLVQSLAAGTWVQTPASSVRRGSSRYASPARVPAGNGAADKNSTGSGTSGARMLAARESPSADDVVVKASAARVELWKYTFDKTRMALDAEKLLETSAPRPL